jgi:putative NADPH-quinone reductase
MRVLVVYCHPVPDSFCAALHRAVLDGLAEAGHEVRDRDLYAEGFDPVLTEAERRAYHDAGANTAGVADHLADLRWAEGLVFVYPTWWYGLPAMLKGWLDRVWVPGEAFLLPDGPGPIRPGLTNIRRLGVVTTHGAPWWWTHLWMMGAGRTVIVRGLKPLFAKGCRHLYHGLHDMDTAAAEKRTAFLDRVRRAYARF